MATNLKQSVYDAKGKAVAEISLPESVWGVKWNADLVHQVVVGMQSNARTGLADTKGRGEVRGGGKKPWRQKGTGRARHGSNRSPIWIGGGTTHGPLSEKNYDKKINKKMRAKALFTALSKKLADGQVLFAQALDLKSIKTKDAMETLKGFATVSGFETLNTKKHNNILLVSPEKTDIIAKSFRNIAHVTFAEARNLNPVDVMNYRYVVVANPEKTNELFEGKMVAKKKVTAKAK